MDSDRKYRQRGYQDSGNVSSGRDANGVSSGNGNGNGNKPRPSGPRPPLDITGPRLPRLVQAVTASRCYNCSTALPPGTIHSGPCPKCGVPLHCCKQCAHFEPSTRFQCTKPIPLRIAVKDQLNACTLFTPRVTVARESSSVQQHANASRLPVPGVNTPPPRNASDARDAFDRLFKK